ncbi:putative oxidoreductase [Cyclobacterium xiamenense]|uniref:Putative oxidoreductase n=1 Tax=Cyclobacterium xiamenense TaxID=1297121 RepID=A0A1H7B381_9BACT|nr:DoxX family protein [Cyclobacterium xiamenense]SEJ67855.1 putative oxidoreductase [Cyclobacterium xiamenense]
MEKYLGKFAPQLYALLRIVAGFSFAMHGSQKLIGWPGGEEPKELFSMMGVAGVVELVGGILIMIGLIGSIAAFISSGQMAVAFFMVHAPQGWNPLLNGGEKALLFCFIFLFIAAKGSGIWSVDGEKVAATS